MKYKKWLFEWLTLYVKPTTKIRTYKKYQMQIELHIIPFLGEVELHDLTATVLQRFTVELSNKGLSANTVNGIITLIKTSLKRAVQVGVAEKEFSSVIVRPKQREKQVECFTKDEKKIELYIAEKKNPRLFGIILTLYTGLRIGELLALTWSNIDLKKGTLTVQKTCRDSWQNGKYLKIIDTPKTDCSTRVIPIPKQLLPHIKALKKKAKSDYVIDGKNEHGAVILFFIHTQTLIFKTKYYPFCFAEIL